MNIEQIYGAEFISIRIGISSSWNIGLQDRFQESLYEGTAHSQLAHLKHVEYVQFYFTGYRVNTNIAYTIFHPLEVEVSCVLFLDSACWLGQKTKHTKLLPQADERPCTYSAAEDEVDGG